MVSHFVISTSDTKRTWRYIVTNLIRVHVCVSHLVEGELVPCHLVAELVQRELTSVSP